MKRVAGIDVDDLDAEVVGEGLHHLFGFVQTQQAVVDEDAGQLVADGAVQQSGDDGGIDAAGQAEYHFVAAHFGTHPADGFFDIVRHVPVGAAAADVVHKARDNGLALQGVGDFGMELYAVESARLVGHAGNRRGGVGTDDPETGRQFGDLVAVAHPHVEQAVPFVVGPVLNIAQQGRVALGADFGITEFALGGVFDLAAELRRHGLHAVADAQHRHAKVEHDVRCAGCFIFIH